MDINDFGEEKNYDKNERGGKMEMRPFTTDYIVRLLNQPIYDLWPSLKIIAQQNELNLCYVDDFEKATDILVKSIILN
jgi:hypothetical protein